MKKIKQEEKNYFRLLKVGIKTYKRKVQYYPCKTHKVIQNKQIFHSKYACDDVLSRSKKHLYAGKLP